MDKDLLIFFCFYKKIQSDLLLLPFLIEREQGVEKHYLFIKKMKKTSDQTGLKSNKRKKALLEIFNDYEQSDNSYSKLTRPQREEWIKMRTDQMKMNISDHVEKTLPLTHELTSIHLFLEDSSQTAVNIDSDLADQVLTEIKKHLVATFEHPTEIKLVYEKNKLFVRAEIKPEKHSASIPEPPPKPGIMDVVPEVHKFIDKNFSGQEKTFFTNLINDRKKYGEEKYGSKLQTFNSRSMKNDAVQELGDFIQYIYGMILEEDTSEDAGKLIRYASIVCPTLLCQWKEMTERVEKRAKVATDHHVQV